MTLPGVCCPNCGYDAANLQSCLYIAPSPFQNLFDNHASREEINAARPHMKKYTDAVRSELHDLEARVARLSQTLQTAEEHLTSAKRVLDAHVLLNPPIESLPAEILSYIFSLTFDRPFDILMRKVRMPWLLGHVCRHWRGLALQTPTLWNSFQGRYYYRRTALHPQKLEEVLNRSGNSALYISLDDITLSRACILAQHASRLAELELQCSFETLSGFKDAPEMSMLTKLCLKLIKIDYNAPEQAYFDIVSKAPRLTHVDLFAISVSIYLPRVLLLPWPQITHLRLKLEEHNYHYIYGILSQCRNLVSFTNRCRDDGAPNPTLLPTPSTIYIFPHLTFLDIFRPLTVLRYMQCPALQTLTLRGADELTETDWQDFRTFIDRSRCTLQEVTCIPERYTVDTRSQFLAAPLREFLSFVKHVPKVVIGPPRRR